MNNAVVCDLRVNNGAASVSYNNEIGIEFSHNVFASADLKQYDLSADPVLADGGKLVYNAENMGFKELSRLKLNPELKKDSPLIGAGIRDRHDAAMSRDVGAVEYKNND